jgi:hypothetical protein
MRLAIRSRGGATSKINPHHAMLEEQEIDPTREAQLARCLLFHPENQNHKDDYC